MPRLHQVTPKTRPAKPAPLRLRTQGWISTDDDEVLRRRIRGQEAGMRVSSPTPAAGIFNDYTVRSNSDQLYQVELRSLTDPINSCTCSDYRINRLGTCKHIEAVLHWLTRKYGSKLQAQGRKSHTKIEVYLDRRDDQVKVSWPPWGIEHLAMQRRLAPLFDGGGLLRGDPLTALSALERTLGHAPAPQKKHVRFSAHVSKWYTELDRRAANVRARQVFEADVASGKRSLDVAKLPLYPYQQEGMLHLAFTGRALLADEMGLGKTAQAIAACELLRQLHGIQRVLVISPASLKTEWEEQIGKFTDQSLRIIIGSRPARLQHYAAPSFFYLTNYEQMLHDADAINQRLKPDVIILDEAQRIKNWQGKIANAVKRLTSRFAFVLTGTPLENRIDEVYSIMQFLDPQVLGPLFRFNRDFYQLDENGRPAGYKNLDELHRRLKPYMLRRRKLDVEEQLPSRTLNTYFVPMDKEQAVYYEEHEKKAARLASIIKRRPLTKEEMERLQRELACMRMVCDTPYILDRNCRISPKIDELRQIVNELLTEGDHKIIIFSEWERMLELVRDLIEKMKLGYARHTGTIPQAQRRLEIRRFKDDPACQFFLSTDSGSVGLNLQVADVVINLDLPWNPARLEQRIARAWRKHQTRPVRVINLVTEHSIEHRMMRILDQKRDLAQSVVDGIEIKSEMALPSGRAAFLERVEALMGLTPEAEIEPAPRLSDPVERVRADAATRWNHRLDLLEIHHGEKTDAVLAVADRVDEPLRASLHQTLAEHYGEQAPGLELIDRATFDVIQRLIQAGVLQPGRQAPESLYRSATMPTKTINQDELRAHAAQLRLSQAEHQRKMATVLEQGGFVIEACKPMREAVETAARAMVALIGENDSETIPLRVVESHLIKRGLLPPESIVLIARLREMEIGLDESQARKLLNQSAELLAAASRTLDLQ